MSNPNSSSHSSQDAAFFGSNTRSSSSSEAKRLNTSDEALARRMAEDWNKEEQAEQAALQNDEIIARRLADEEASPSQISSSQPTQRALQSDEIMARRLADEEASSAQCTSSPVTPPPPPSSSSTSSSSSTNSSALTSILNKASNLFNSLSVQSTLEDTCFTCGDPLYAGGGQISALGRTYHANDQCFLCAACAAPILETEFNSSTEFGDGIGALPIHRMCYTDLFLPKCNVCRRAPPQNSIDGSYSYSKHSFFQDWKHCNHHADLRRCTGCARVEPNKDVGGFNEIHDNGRCLCDSCCRSVILDSSDLKSLWENVCNFLQTLGLRELEGMREVPVLSVNYATLNEMSTSNSSTHGKSNGSVTRGLCLSEQTHTTQIRVPAYKYLGIFKGYQQTFQETDIEKKSDVAVTAVLCLSGLPRDLTASILAHESLHAWFKLHPTYQRGGRKFACSHVHQQVEEGCCQLIAFLYLNHLEDLDVSSNKTETKSNNVSKSKPEETPTDAELRSYFKFSIESDSSEIYGAGFRKAAELYAQIGLEPLLQHVMETGRWPFL